MGEEEKKEEVKKVEDVQEDAEFDEAFDELAAEATPDPDADKSVDAKPEDDQSEEGEKQPAQAGEKKEDEEEKDPPSEVEDPPPELDEEKTTLEKRLKDTQAKLTQTSQELAEKKKAEAEQETEKTKEEVLAELPENVKEFLEEYPEFAEAMEHHSGSMVKVELAEALKPIRLAFQELVGTVDTLQFMNQVIGGYWEDGKYIEGHADAAAIFGREDFQKFLEGEPELKDANTPDIAISAIGRFKEGLAGKAVEDHDKKAAEKGKEVKKAAESTVDDKPRRAAEDVKASEDDFDAAWDQIT